MKRVAVVLFNLGGPDRPAAIQPFLFNLFNDPAIIGAPQPIRYLLAKLISARRAPVAAAIYAQIGGGSPLLANTRAQATALQRALADLGEARAFTAMRYWHPMSDEVAAEVKAFGPDEIILLPLYPQFSTTTTGSSSRAWSVAARRAGLGVPTRIVCCYPTEPGFIAALAALVRQGYDAAQAHGAPRVLFSAHGLPKKVVRAGDPYQSQVEASAAAVAAAATIPGLDWRVCYQSRVGPLEWIGPDTEAEIERAGRDGVPVIVAPISFVNEHSETLVELDIEYRAHAARHNVPYYVRVPTVSVETAFIGGLARLVRDSLARPAASCAANGGKRLCPATANRCLMAAR
ncbi:MAG: ferrochelatase [Rhodospirillales bacterium]|nr:ferrochelatase [Rhodospirillales bacterium]